MKIIKHVTKSANHAINGILVTFKNEVMFRFHLTLYLTIVILMNVLNFESSAKYTLIVFAIVTLCLELLNTAIEDCVDLIVKENFHPLAKKAKDVSGGAVFLCAVSGYTFFLIQAFLIIIT